MSPALKMPKTEPTSEAVMESSFIAKIAYDPEQLTLTVTMKNGSEYEHSGIYQAQYDGFMEAKSKGSYYGKNIKGKSPTERTISRNTGPALRNPLRGPTKTGRI